MTDAEEAELLGLSRESAEVYYAKGTVTQANAAIVDFLRRAAANSPRRRCRLCLHSSPQARQQEMLIVMHRDSIVVPHRHAGKDETLLVLEGVAAAPLFDAQGQITEVIDLGPPGSGRCFFYHMPEGVLHGLAIESDWLVYVETTLGPFRRDATVFPAWAPVESDSAAVDAFQARIQRAIGEARTRSPGSG